MSRVGKKLIPIPQGVEVKLADRTVMVKGPKGELKQLLPPSIDMKVESGKVQITRSGETPKLRALHGLARSLVNNMVNGVSKGFSKELEIIGIGFKAEVKGSNKIEFALGFTHPVIFNLPSGIRAEVDKTANILKLNGADRQLIGQLAAQIRSIRPPEPYKGTGIKYVGEVIRRKAGKAAAGASGGGK